jgi:hypothetical protein
MAFTRPYSGPDVIIVSENTPSCNAHPRHPIKIAIRWVLIKSIALEEDIWVVILNIVEFLEMPDKSAVTLTIRGVPATCFT